MWICKHCKNKFNYTKTTEKANHSRWCNKNPKRNNTLNLVKAQNKINNNKFGELKTYIVGCHNCENKIEIKEREKQYPKKDKYFCSKKCANSEGGKMKAIKDEENNNMNYRTLGKKYNKNECLICGFDKIIEIHHVNENHLDNNKENLVILCPNHHKMYHSRYKDEISIHISEYILKKYYSK